MKKLPVYFLFLIFLVSSFSVAEASSAIFSDGFENGFSEWMGNDEKWTTSGTSVPNGVKSGEKRAEVKGNTEPGDDVLLKNISTAGLKNISLDFWYRIKESLEDDDHLYVEWTGDGNNWNIIKDFTLVSSSAVWESASFPIPVEAEDKQDFAIRFRAHLGAVTSDIFYLDDIVVSAGSIINEPTPTPDSIGSPQPILTPEATLTSTPTPEAMLTPTPPAPTSKPASSASPKPSMQATISVPPVSNISPILITSSLPKAEKQESTQIVSAALSPEVSVRSDSDSTDLSNLPKSDSEDEGIVSETSNSFFASISNFFNNSKFFWLISAMVLAVVFSLAKPKNN